MGDKGVDFKEEMPMASAVPFNETVKHLDEIPDTGNLNCVNLPISGGIPANVPRLRDESCLASRNLLASAAEKSQQILNSGATIDLEFHTNASSSGLSPTLDKHLTSLHSSGCEAQKVSEQEEKRFPPTEYKNSYTDEQKIRNSVLVLPDSEQHEPQQKKFSRMHMDPADADHRPIGKDAESVKLKKELAECQERETRLKRECERLRAHLLQTEDRYTREAVEAEEREEQLKKSLTALKQEMVSSNTDVLNAKSSAARQTESLRIQLNLLMEQRDDALKKLANAEETISSYSSSLANLQMVLEQFQEETRHNQSVELELCQKDLEKERLTTHNLNTEKLELQKKLAEMTEIADSTHCLKRQIAENVEQIKILQIKLQEREAEFSEAEIKWQQISAVSEDKIDRLLVKNLLMGFISTPPAKRTEAFTVVGHILGFTDHELESIGVSNSGSWLRGLFHNAVVASPGTNAETNSNYSFSELFIRFLEKESTPLPQPKLPAERMAQEHQEKQQRLFQSSPVTADLSYLVTAPETPATEKLATYSHSAVSPLFPVEHSDQFVDCKKSDISLNDSLQFVSETGHSKIPIAETSSVLIE